MGGLNWVLMGGVTLEGCGRRGILECQVTYSWHGVSGWERLTRE